MKFELLLLSLPLLALGAPAPAPVPAPAAGNGGLNAPGYNQAEGLATRRDVEFPPKVHNVIVGAEDPRTIEELLADAGLEEADVLQVFDNAAFKGFSASMYDHHVVRLNANSATKVCEPDMEIEMLDKVWGTWGLKRMSQEGPLDVAGRDVAAYDFESYEFDGPAEGLGKGVDIYMFDTGVNVNHTGFNGRAKSGYSFDNDPTDDTGHGTHTAGIAGSSILGVARGATIIALRVLSGNPKLEFRGSMLTLLAGIDWMVVQHRKRSSSPEFRGSVASMSLISKDDSAVLDVAVRAASAAGIHFSVGAGNDNEDACGSSPSRISTSSDVISVGSTNAQDLRSPFSNFGECVTVYAPGETITSTWNAPGNNTVNTISGTSMACPHVSGLMAVFLSQDPSLNTGALKQKIVAMAKPIPLRDDPMLGNGQVLLINNGKLEENNGSPING